MQSEPQVIRPGVRRSLKTRPPSIFAVVSLALVLVFGSPLLPAQAAVRAQTTDGTVDDAQAVEQMADRYGRLCEIWDKARADARLNDA